MGGSSLTPAVLLNGLSSRYVEKPSAPSFCAGIALAVEVFRKELERLHGVAPEVQLSDGRALIRRSLCELLAHHEDVQLELRDFGAR